MYVSIYMYSVAESSMLCCINVSMVLQPAACGVSMQHEACTVSDVEFPSRGGIKLPPGLGEVPSNNSSYFGGHFLGTMAWPVK